MLTDRRFETPLEADEACSMYCPGRRLLNRKVPLAVLLATSVLMPWPQLVAAAPAWATGYATERSLGAIGLGILTLAVLMGIFTGINGFFMASSRLRFLRGESCRMLP